MIWVYDSFSWGTVPTMSGSLRVCMIVRCWAVDCNSWVVTSFTLNLGNFEVHSLAVKARISSWCRCTDKDALNTSFWFDIFLLICIIGPFRGFIFKTLVIDLQKPKKRLEILHFIFLLHLCLQIMWQPAPKGIFEWWVQRICKT